MKFGYMPLSEAEGAILAHSERLPEGRLRKGKTLTQEDIQSLRLADLTEVAVAILEAGDVHEDIAAQRLAEAASGTASGLSLSQAFTGRVNVVADGPGVVEINAERITQANLVDPALTIATVPPFFQARAGSMIATVKIITYGVGEQQLHLASESVRNAISFATPKYATASLIVSETDQGPGLRSAEAIAHRLEGLGLELCQTVSCPHEVVAMSKAIQASSGQIILILTSSATSDARDTAPNALRHAGGEVTRFGIPVDPGNLLFLGKLGKRPVIGLPNSARSPVLHGADWVLSRVACGVGLEDMDFAAMGVGGLLKEMPTRPQPRRARR